MTNSFRHNRGDNSNRPEPARRPGGEAPRDGRGPSGPRRDQSAVAAASDRDRGRPSSGRPASADRDRGRPPGDQDRGRLEIDEDITGRELDRLASDRLRTLSPLTAQRVARHLVMVHRYLAADPKLALAHATAALRDAGRVDVVREAAGLAAYAAGDYAQALRELRTARRLSGTQDLLPVMADCERGLGRPERAVQLAASPEAEQLDSNGQVEMGLVLAGARLDLKQPEAALAALAQLRPADRPAAARIAVVRADVLTELGRTDEAAAERDRAAKLDPQAFDDEPEQSITIYDLETDDAQHLAETPRQTSEAQPEIDE